MNRVLRTLLVSAAVLLSGTVAFTVAAAITPPGVDGVNVVVTDRPVLAAAAASTLLPTAPAAAGEAPTPRADKPASADAPTARNKTVVTGTTSGSGSRSIVVPAVKPKPPTVKADDETDHEVVTPPVRDEDDDEEDDDDEDKDGSSSPSSDFTPDRSDDTTGRSGYKGD